MLISRPSNSGLKRLINIQKCRSSTKLDHCALPVSDLIYVYCLWHCTGLDCRNFGLVVAAK